MHFKYQAVTQSDAYFVQSIPPSIYLIYFCDLNSSLSHQYIYFKNILLAIKNDLTRAIITL